MRFEQQLVFNASNEWVDEYINYTALKAAVYRAEKEALSYRQADQEQQDEEQATLLGRGGGPAGEASTSDNAAITPDTLSARFKVLLDAELAKIEKFYTRKEGELFSELEQVREEIQQVEDEGQFGDFEEESDEESGESENEDDTGATKLLKKSTRLFRSVVGASGPSSSHHNRRRSSGAEGAEPPYGHRRSGSSSSGKLRRQRSHTASEGSNNSSTEALGPSNSRNVPKLPAEVSEDIESQINRTMQAATRPSSPAIANGGEVQQSPFSPADAPKPSLRGRASSFGAGVARDVSTADIWNSSSRAAQDLRITYKMRLQSLFRELSQLKEYVTLNQSR
jgi:phosphate transporter